MDVDVVTVGTVPLPSAGPPPSAIHLNSSGGVLTGMGRVKASRSQGASHDNCAHTPFSCLLYHMIGLTCICRRCFRGKDPLKDKL